jgi:hypothetical protein
MVDHPSTPDDDDALSEEDLAAVVGGFGTEVGQSIFGQNTALGEAI